MPTTGGRETVDPVLNQIASDIAVYERIPNNMRVAEDEKKTQSQAGDQRDKRVTCESLRRIVHR